MEPSLRKQFTIYNGRRYRMCAYKVWSEEQRASKLGVHEPAEWAGFVEDDHHYLGGSGQHPTRRATMIALAKIIATDQSKRLARRSA